jgi:protein ImuA
VIYVEAEREAALLTCFEDSLRHGGLGGVVAEVAKLSMVASRRLQLAAEASGTPGFALRRWRRHADATDFGHPTAALTRWRISALPSTPLEGAGIGRARWLVELIRQRNGGSADFIVEACDATGRLGLSSNMAGRPAVATPRDKQASA